jgi:hypothetical protein
MVPERRRCARRGQGVTNAVAGERELRQDAATDEVRLAKEIHAHSSRFSWNTR